MLLILMFISSLTEVVSIGVIIPFLSVISNPQWLFNNKYGKILVELFNLNSASQLVFLVTIIFIIAIVVSAFMRLLLLWVQTKLSYSVGSELAFKVYTNLLYQPYEEFLKKNSSEIISAVGKSKSLVWTIIVPLLTIISSALMLIMILLTIFTISPLIAIFSIICFSFFYFLIIIFTKNRVAYSSKIIDKESAQVIKVLQEGM